MDRHDTRSALGLAAGAALLLFFDAGTRVLATNDEARFAVLARDILDHGTWLLPRLGDTPYLNKPPLMAWLIALVSWPLGGVTQGTAVWPSLAAAVGLVLTTWWVGRRLWDQAVGLTAGFLVLTTHAVFTQARTSMPDVVLCLAMTAAMAAYVASDFGMRPSTMRLCYLFLALGFLVKGPAALLGLVVIAVHGLLTREGTWWRRLAPLRGALLIVLVIGAWWLVAMRSRGSEFVQDTVVIDWLEWFDPSARVRMRSLLWPFAAALEAGLPWSVLLPIAIVAAIRARRRLADVTFLLTWLGVIFAVVALSSQQRVRYYLPLCPAAALLVAVWYHRVLGARRAVLGWVTAAAVTVAFVAGQVRDNARHNAATQLDAVGAVAARGDLPLFAFGAPNLVAAFYVDRPVAAIDAKSVRDVRLPPGYFVVDQRALSRWPEACSTEQMGSGTANGRPFAVLRLAPPGCFQLARSNG